VVGRGVGTALLAVVLGLTGCASIVGGQNQVVSVQTPGCDGARCELTNDKGTWFVPVTPGTVTIVRSYNNLQVTCRRGTVVSVPASFASTTKGLAFGNILLGGIIGAGIDAGTGAAYDYPALLTVSLSCGSEAPADAPAPAGTGPRLGLQVAGAAGDGATGLQVLAVDADSPAGRAGLRAGDRIVRANDSALTRPDELARLLATLQAPWSLQLVVRRDGEETTVRVVSDPPATPANVLERKPS
jgi:membrane-associated protease RseP (regulator of RpoE activity)